MTKIHNSIEFFLIPLKHNTNYFISKSGQVLNAKRMKIKYGSPNKYGYLLTNISIGCKSKTYSIHRMVAITFLENKNNKPQVNHIDGDKLNNHLANLEWCTHSENLKHAYSNGLKTNRGEKHPSNKLTASQVLEIREIFNLGGRSRASIARDYKVSNSTIERIISRKSWSHI